MTLDVMALDVGSVLLDAIYAPGSAAHGLNVCQGTIAKMSTEATAYVLRTIYEFSARGRISMVHFRHIKGGSLDCHECVPDEGSVDMAAFVRAYRAVGHEGILCPDHVPLSDLDRAHARFFSVALGDTRGLLQAAEVAGVPLHFDRHS